MSIDSWVDDATAGLLTDLYELTMLQAYWQKGMHDEAVFSLFTRKLPAGRNYLLACGLDDVLRYLENLRFDQSCLEALKKLEQFSDGFLDWLADFRFSGDVWAMAEGTPFFPDEPILEVRAPIDQAQLAETFIMNQVHLQTVLASKASRMVTAAGDRAVVDFGLRRMHGTDAGVKAARAFHIAGIHSTSNVLAGAAYDIPVSGTMAHSFIEAHDSEMAAFRDFASVYPKTILLVDTYDTLDGVRKVIDLAHELGDDFQVRGVRLDSGDLADLAVTSRRLLDQAGLDQVLIFASGSLDEQRIAEMLATGAPINGFGVGTRMGVSADAPYLDMVYKLTEYAGKGRLKTSSGKQTLPGQKQVFRQEENGRAGRDIVAQHHEYHPGRPLLGKVMENGTRLEAGKVSVGAAREHCHNELSRLPGRLLALEQAAPPYPVEVSDHLARKRDEVRERVKK